jgi:predicted Rossmann fold flavoprotein
MTSKTLVVIGGGAAGFFCAVNAARLCPDLIVILLEKTNKLLSKVKVSGGGRCNVTHNCQSISEMVKRYPRGGNFLKKSFHHFFTTDTISWFEKRGIKLHAEEDGRMFPVTNNSQTIVDCLLHEAETYTVDIRMSTEVKSLNYKGEGWEILTGKGIIDADFVCVACGGFPKSEQFSFLSGTGHRWVKPVPSLFTFNLQNKKITQLMGLTADPVQVKISGTKLIEQGPLLITHWGFSGPAILKLSAWGARILEEKNYEFDIMVNWCPAYNETSVLPKLSLQRTDHPSKKIINSHVFDLPARLWEFLISESAIDEHMRWADLPAKLQNQLAKNLCSAVFHIKGKTTFKEEFVTAGGIDLNDIDPTSMKSRLKKGLYFAGEIMDVDGITGGYNFQHAWTSGYLAAESISKMLI